MGKDPSGRPRQQGVGILLRPHDTAAHQEHRQHEPRRPRRGPRLPLPPPFQPLCGALLGERLVEGQPGRAAGVHTGGHPGLGRHSSLGAAQLSRERGERRSRAVGCLHVRLRGESGGTVLVRPHRRRNLQASPEFPAVFGEIGRRSQALCALHGLPGQPERNDLPDGLRKPAAAEAGNPGAAVHWVILLPWFNAGKR
ncbi:hypothetical protein SDC9_180984 [bioreactor metagenome]|uniref:Uncharacterized protein n=1 Tax=bioreactor metagenome TaxID=1076179 RepID=A0A645H4U4_9ZZZZ